jgi:predicted O-methyltransferase YrrM
MNTLKKDQVAQTLHKLHRQAAENRKRFLSISPEQGRLLYFLASTRNAQSIVEFGCSMGISAIYLAAAADDNEGHLTTTEIDDSKYAQARQNISDAGLSDRITLLEGDAEQTLSSYDNSIDLLFMDGAKDLYRPIFKLLYPKLSNDAIIIADNIDRPETRPFLNYFDEVDPAATCIQLFDDRMLIAKRK